MLCQRVYMLSFISYAINFEKNCLLLNLDLQFLKCFSCMHLWSMFSKCWRSVIVTGVVLLLLTSSYTFWFCILQIALFILIINSYKFCWDCIYLFKLSIHTLISLCALHPDKKLAFHECLSPPFACLMHHCQPFLSVQI